MPETTPLHISYGAYNIFQRYWYSQGDPLYAVLSRRGTSVDRVRVPEASVEEVRRIHDLAIKLYEENYDEAKNLITNFAIYNTAKSFLNDNRGLRTWLKRQES